MDNRRTILWALFAGMTLVVWTKWQQDQRAALPPEQLASPEAELAPMVCQLVVAARFLRVGSQYRRRLRARRHGQLGGHPLRHCVRRPLPWLRPLRVRELQPV